jgi:hypothetical protein
LSTFGQMGIRLREALAAGDGPAAAAELPTLDEAHLIELVLGAALRDARDGFGAARRFVELWTDLPGNLGSPAWTALCGALASPGADRRYDDLAAAYVAAGRAPEGWTPEGAEPDVDPRRSPQPDVLVADALTRGVGGLALLRRFADRPLHAPVALYYEVGTIHALGPRPLLVLAATAGDPPQGSV